MPDYHELAGLDASVDRVEHTRDAQNSAGRPHRFVYHITIRNDTLRVVTISGRKWLIVNEQGQRLMIEGDGLLGQFPRLTPGDRFRYNSYHLVNTTSVAEGVYFARDEDGQNLLIRIPSFKLVVPADADVQPR
ncbi:MAG: ApaG domain [Verrucomicrobiales bacterium]|jgi:ApaG protein|nr:ApaG domain [Verrucomicrobiales bacterium]